MGRIIKIKNDVSKALELQESMGWALLNAEVVIFADEDNYDFAAGSM